MALQIGDVSFGIEANTNDLRKAIGQLKRFRQQINRVAKAQTAGATQAATALGRQESAIKKALQQTVALRLQLTNLKAGKAPILEVRNAMRRLTLEMTSGKLTTVQFTRSMDAFQAKLGRVRRGLGDLRADKATNEVKKLTQVMRNLESASVLAIGPLSGVGARIRSLSAITTRSTALMAGFLAIIAGVGFALFKMGQSALSAARIFEAANARFIAASGSVAIANKQMGFVIKTARSLGLRIDQSAKAFSRLTAASRGTILEGNGVRKIFVAVSKCATRVYLVISGQ